MAASARKYWFLYYLTLPPKGMVVDHINRDRTDNRKENLRLATYHQNGYNAVHYNPYDRKGVTYDEERRKWRAQIRIKGIKVNLGRFETMEEAAKAYERVATKYHGEFLCLNPLKIR